MNESDLYTAVGLFVASRVVFVAGFAALAVVALRGGKQAFDGLQSVPVRMSASFRQRVAGTR